MVAQTRKGAGKSPKKLKFNEKLVGKGHSTDTLLKKLKALHIELAELDQENVDTKSLTSVCKELISTSILLHKDKGVKAYAACCIADLLRLFAPDAPYTGQELRDIFQFFFRQLSVGLKGSDSPYYNEYFHLLESLSTVKSVVLVCDLPQADELMVQVFRDFFGLVRQDLAKNVEMFMADILIALIDESQSLPNDVLESIMSQFMDKNARMDQPAYRLAVEICNATSDKLQRHVCQYFTDIIVQHSQNEDFDQVRDAHELIKRLNHSCPNLLHNVVPQLEEELRVDEVQLRQMATQVLGEMFADNAGGDLEKKYPSTWSLWLDRKNDKSAPVRLAFVEGCKGLLQHHRTDLRESVESSLKQKLLDPDDKVRAAVCKLYAELDYETTLHYVSEEQLRALGDRAMDKKQTVRQEAITSIAKLYSIAYPQIEANDAAAIKHFSWIPEQIMHALTATLEVRVLAEQVISEYILPLPSKGEDEVAWTDRLLTVMRFLDEKGVNALIAISGIKRARPSPYEVYLNCCIENNGGIIDENEEAVKRKLAAIIRNVSSSFPDAQKAAEDLQNFARLNEQRLYKLMKTCMDPQTDLKGLVKAMNEFARRLEHSCRATLIPLLRQASLWIINQSSVPTLVKRLQKADNATSSKGKSKTPTPVQFAAMHSQLILTTFSKHCPAVYRPHVSEFAKAIADEKHPHTVEICLQALASVARWDGSLAPSEKRTVDRLLRYAKDSESRHAKFATRILAHSKNKEKICAELTEFIAKNLAEADAEVLVAHLTALIEIVRFAPDAFEEHSEVIVEFLLNQVLRVPSTLEDDGMEVDDLPDWMPEEELPALARAKIRAIKICRHRCLVQSQSESALITARPVIKLLVTLVQNAGLITEDAREHPAVSSYVRLQAACSLLHLATIEKFSGEILPHFVLIVLTVQDPVFDVRLAFVTKLTVILQQRKLHPRFYLALFLTAHDPEEEIKTKASSFLTMSFMRASPEMKLSYFEMIFIRFLHLLAHHPDFSVDEEQIRGMAKYIQFYLSIIATSDNVPLLYHLAAKAKTVRDAESHTYSENLYALSELAQELIKGHAKLKNWSITSYPGKVKLPVDIFRGLPNPEAASKILKTPYLPEHILKALDDVVHKPLPKDKPKPERKVATKRKASTKSNGTGKRTKTAVKRRARRTTDDDDEDDEDRSDEASSDEERNGAKSASSRLTTPAPESDAEGSDGEGDEDKEEDLGRGARTRAKVKARRQARRKQVKTANSVSEE